MDAMGAITDVPGIRVGHAQKSDDGWLTGVTVVLAPPWPSAGARRTAAGSRCPGE